MDQFKFYPTLISVVQSDGTVMPSPAGEGGPLLRWMRSHFPSKHLIRQPSAATFPHWGRLYGATALVCRNKSSIAPRFIQGLCPVSLPYQ